MKRILFLNKFRRAAMALLLLLTMTAQTAWADEVTYIKADGTECTVDATMITSETTQMGESETTTWYCVSGEVTIDNRIELKGTVNLILADDCNFTARQGLHLTPGNTLNIYVQSLGNGRLYASYSGNNAAIGGDGGSDEEDQGGNGEDAGNVNIFGGVIETSGNIGGGNGGEGFGMVVGEDCDEDGCWDIYDGGYGGDGGDGGIIRIYGGQIKVSGAIGGGDGGFGNISWGTDGDGTISLSWTNATDYVDIHEYHGMVELLKLFVDEQHEIYELGEQDDIDGTKLLSTAVRFHAEAAATCTEVGYTQDCWYDYITQKYYLDEGCTQEIAESDVVIDALGHAFEHFDATPATFTHDGNLEYWHCTRCDMCFLDEDGKNAIDAADTTFEGGKGNATDGYYVLMPRQGTKTIELDNSITTFKVYDDGGADNDYSNMCDGYLVLTAPEGYLIQLTGSLLTETDCDYLTVYAGTTTNGNVLLEKKWSDKDDESNPVSTSIGTHAASSMLLYFHSDGYKQYEGLNLTATLGKKVPYNIAIGEISGGSVTVPATAVFGDEVTLTATPTGDNLLKGITVVNNQTNEEVTVTGGTWYNNTAKFSMPNADVTVTATFSDDKSSLSINMPKTGTLTIDLTSDITSVSIYDDGGANNDYSNDCDGYLVLTAPEGYAIQLTGSLLTETYCDNLTVYAGTTTDGYVLLWEKWSDEGDEYNPVSTSIGTHTASSMLLYFYSDGSLQYEGLNLTATLVPPAESIKMNAHGIMTYASAYDLDFTSVSGLTAYVATSISGNTLTLEPVDEVPGGTGLLLRGTAGATFNVNTMDNATAINDNLLVGLTEATLVNQTTDEGIAFILGNGDHGINWYKLAEENYTLKAHSAYLRLPADVAPSEARALTMVFEEASGIYSATLNENGELTDDRWYTLEGVRLSSKPAKPGIYVNNGKKTVIK